MGLLMILPCPNWSARTVQFKKKHSQGDPSGQTVHPGSKFGARQAGQATDSRTVLPPVSLAQLPATHLLF
jgi:hypothetical protein